MKNLWETLFNLKTFYMRLIILMLLPFSLFSQVLKLESGVTYGNLNQELIQGVKMFNESAFGYYATIGVDYLQKKKFNLSSNIGVMQKNGATMLTYTDASGNESYQAKHTERFENLTLNTFAEYSLLEKSFTPFVFAGARIDYMLSKFDERLAIGATAGAGIKYTSGKLLIGFRAGYLPSFKKAAKLNDNTFSGALMIGYNL